MSRSAERSARRSPAAGSSTSPTSPPSLPRRACTVDLLTSQLDSRTSAGVNLTFHFRDGRTVAGAVTRPTYSGGVTDPQRAYVVADGTGHSHLVDLGEVIAVSITL